MRLNSESFSKYHNVREKEVVEDVDPVRTIKSEVIITTNTNNNATSNPEQLQPQPQQWTAILVACAAGALSQATHEVATFIRVDHPNEEWSVWARLQCILTVCVRKRLDGTFCMSSCVQSNTVVV